MSFLDNEGLRTYTAKIRSLLSGFVPSTRTVNGKALSSNITLTAANVSAVPTSRTINGKALSSNITITASDIDLSLYAPKASPVFTESISMGRKSATTVGKDSVVLGYNCEASDLRSFATGYNTKSTDSDSHTEGFYTEALNANAHAEGNSTTASGRNSHAEGHDTTASGDNSHAEGYHTVSSSYHAHAEGLWTTASSFASHASGKYSKQMNDNTDSSTLTGDVFVIGNGTNSSSLSNALRLAYEGTLYLTKAYKSTGADYAEYFEWLDGNPDAEDRVGHFVTLKGSKIVYAEPSDYVLGVVSGQPCIIGNADEDWLGRWVHDDFNRFVKEYLLMHEIEVTPPQDATEAELVDWIAQNSIEERDGHYFKMEEEIVDHPTPHWRHKANPSYDATQAYIERQDRKEWDAVGMVGVLSVIDDGSCVVNGYAKVASNGIATKAESLEFATSWRVVGRVSDHIVKIVFSV